MKNTSIKIVPYLMFEGNCEEALNFYQKTIGGDITIVNRYNNPAMNAPEAYQNKILHARWIFNGGAVYASDTYPGQTTHKNSGDVSLSLILDNLEKAKEVYRALSEGGKATMPFEKQFWGDWHGNLVDRYGFRWNINSEENKS